MGSALLVILLFQPWISAEGPDGTATSNAFGTLHYTSLLLSLWSSSPPHRASISGAWGILTGLAAMCTLCSVMADLRGLNVGRSYVTAGLAAATAIFASATLIYLNSKCGELEHMLKAGPATDAGTQAGLRIRWLAGNGSYPLPGLYQSSLTSAKLTHWAIFAAAVSAIMAVATIDRLRRDDLLKRVRSVRNSQTSILPTPLALTEPDMVPPGPAPTD
ncbi:hypothetical protein [Nocardia sp. CDC160]|uniref:hypothetical protein n=1 Tax=Nocardia sp. CDC160 TaxID=3112166 RepID=UPI002DBA802D|nr:hypothetical protein [Nocardia sp. CDC160]MEC3920372.1 hypothetical protein [Nocardia sp. CDC160]